MRINQQHDEALTFAINEMSRVKEELIAALRGYPGTSYRFRPPLFGNGIQGGVPG